MSKQKFDGIAMLKFVDGIYESQILFLQRLLKMRERIIVKIQSGDENTEADETRDLVADIHNVQFGSLQELKRMDEAKRIQKLVTQAIVEVQAGLKALEEATELDEDLRSILRIQFDCILRGLAEV